MVIAGGVNASMGQHIQVRLDQIDMLSPSGRCFTFDEAGDGTIISEGIGIVVLKNLEDAVRDKDPIYGVIKASGMNQDGASNGITAPSGASQEELIKSVYERFEINPEDISYVEAHGTGTKLGDPIETNALVRAFKSFTDKTDFCAVGSAKSHIGHTGAAAGVVGLIKVLSSMRHKTLPKLLNFNTLNPLIEFADSPFQINQTLTKWKRLDEKPRMAAINSFGHSGTNIHMVVEEYCESNRDTHDHSAAYSEHINDQIIVLSAMSKEQVAYKVQELLDSLNAETKELTSIAYTLQTAREPLNCRLSFVARSFTHLKDCLAEIVSDGIRESNAHINYQDIDELSTENTHGRLVENPLDYEDFDLIAKSWANGSYIDWQLIHVGLKNRSTLPHRTNLPGYPFAKERYWIDQTNLAAFPESENDNREMDTKIRIEPNGSGASSVYSVLDQLESGALSSNEGAELLKNIDIKTQH